ncbi:histidine kinase [Pseudomaricurvus alcaniphilus]|uniref:sensor histidine kinase n=1 Tax=Pseudomaricurvus alcaniphilus TaxID=1166482 RepID=UPI00140D48FA|nr:histidine kinase [Pseudomaricurvus alcaniphilus]NHN36939.1 histidine kinase [Pseudomaricurvus alcaniphilus]
MTTTTARFIDSVRSSRRKQFWLLQGAGWFGLCFITFFSLTLWYDQLDWPYLAHIFLQALLGLLLSLPLHLLYQALWGKPILLQLLLDSAAVAITAALWTALRLVTFYWLTREPNLLQDFGGWYFGSLMIFLCWSAIYFSIRFYLLFQSEHDHLIETEAWAESEKWKRLEAESAARESQLKMLRYQLTPHFLFNTLNAIAALVQVQQSDDAHKMIVNLSNFLRLSLDHNPTAKITVEQEIAALMLYLNIEKARFGERLHIDLDVAETAKQALVPSLLYQPLVENSIKYAIAMNEDGGTIRVSARDSGEQLLLEVEDTGPQLQASGAKPLSGRKIGLQNTIERLNGFYGKQNYRFDMQPLAPSGLKISIAIPLEEFPDY